MYKVIVKAEFKTTKYHEFVVSVPDMKAAINKAIDAAGELSWSDIEGDETTDLEVEEASLHNPSE